MIKLFHAEFELEKENVGPAQSTHLTKHYEG